MFFSFPKLGIKCLLSLSNGGIKYIWRYHLDVLWQENLRKKHCDYNVDICNNKKVERMLYNKKKIRQEFLRQLHLD